MLELVCKLAVNDYLEAEPWNTPEIKYFYRALIARFSDLHAKFCRTNITLNVVSFRQAFYIILKKKYE